LDVLGDEAVVTRDCDPHRVSLLYLITLNPLMTLSVHSFPWKCHHEQGSIEGQVARRYG
jgi:hypothetical protein